MKDIKEKNQSNWLRKRQEIISAASRLFWRKGYQVTTIEDIGKAIKMNKAGIYYYFENKNSILHEIASNAMEELLNLAQPIESSEMRPIEKLQRLVMYHVKWGLQHLGPVAVGQLEMRSMKSKFLQSYIIMRDRYEAIFRAVIKEGVDKGEFRDLDPRLTCLFVMGLLNSIAAWFKPTGGLSSEEIASKVFEFISASLKAS